MADLEGHLMLCQKNSCFILFEIGFSATHIACMLGVSVRTIRRRMNDIGLRVSDLYSALPDNELDIIVNEILIQFPNSGYRMMTGHLKR